MLVIVTLRYPYNLYGIVYSLRGCSDDIAGTVGVGVGVTYIKFIERIPIVISLSFDIS